MLACRSKIVFDRRGFANKRHKISSTTRKLDRFSCSIFCVFAFPCFRFPFAFCKNKFSPIAVLRTLNRILHEEGQHRSICSWRWTLGNLQDGCSFTEQRVLLTLVSQSQSAILAPSTCTKHRRLPNRDPLEAATLHAGPIYSPFPLPFPNHQLPRSCKPCARYDSRHPNLLRCYRPAKRPDRKKGMTQRNRFHRLLGLNNRSSQAIAS
ncbi:hypothetical protein V8C44DRAFT_118857 [Trichoderma aethiopicum]